MTSEPLRIAKLAFIGTIVAAIIAAIGGIIVAIINNSHSTSVQSAHEATSSPEPLSTASVPTPLASLTPGTTVSPIPTDATPVLSPDNVASNPPNNGNPTVDATVQPSLQYCSSLQPVGGLGNWEALGSIQMGRTTYGNSLEFSPSSFVSARLSMTFNIPSGLRHFRAQVGFDDRSVDGSSAFFQIMLGQTPVDSGFTLDVGQEKPIDLIITGAQRLTVEVEVTKRPSGTVNAPLHAVWGNARFSED